MRCSFCCVRNRFQLQTCLQKYGQVTGLESFFSIHLYIQTSAKCILLVRTTKLLAQKVRHDNHLAILYGKQHGDDFSNGLSMFPFGILEFHLHIRFTLGCFYQLVLDTSDKSSNAFCLFVPHNKPTQTLSAKLAEIF